MPDTNQSLAHITLVVRDYDEAIDFYTRVLGFSLVADTTLSANKRWVIVAPSGGGVSLLLAKAATYEQKQCIGNQTGGRVFLFLHTDDFERDYTRLQSHGVRFTGEPRTESYGHVVVFADLYGNLWDLIQPTTDEK